MPDAPMLTHVWDWQAWASLGIGLAAVAYLLRRWWPRTLATQAASTCDTPNPNAGSITSKGCGSCSGCGTSVRDHRQATAETPPQRVHWRPQPPASH